RGDCCVCDEKNRGAGQQLQNRLSVSWTSVLSVAGRFVAGPGDSTSVGVSFLGALLPAEDTSSSTHDTKILMGKSTSLARLRTITLGIR
ncbi:unnamed protein product, partial [Amoebophrya sp. A25]